MAQKMIVVPKILSDEELQISVKAENTPGTENESVTINSLNFDCLQNIFNYLPIKDRIAAERVSKHWNDVSKASWGSFNSLNFKQNLWGLKKKFETRSNEDRLKMLKSVLSRCGKFLKSLDLYHFSKDRQDENLSDLIWNVVKTNCTNLKNLHMDCNILICPSSIQALKVIIKNIQKLQLLEIDDNITDKDLKLLFSSCKELEDLTISIEKSITGEFLNFLNREKIKRLTLYYTTLHNEMYYAVQKFENLETLCMERHGYDDSLNGFNLECPKTLKSIDIMDSNIKNLSFSSEMNSLTELSLLETFVSDSLLLKIAKHCSKLQRLMLSSYDRSSNATDRGVQALSALPQLEDLDLGGLPAITGSSFKYFSTLKKFAVSGLYNLDGKSLCYVLQNCEELEELSIHANGEDPHGDYQDIAIEFFTSAKEFLELRYSINNRPLKIVLYNGFVIVTSNALINSKQAKLYFELYAQKNCKRNETRLILGTNDILQLIDTLKVDDLLLFSDRLYFS